MSVLKKIALLIVMPILALLLFGGISINGINKLNGYLHQVNNDAIPSMKNISKTQFQFTLMHALVYRHIVTPADKVQDTEKRILALRDHIAQQVERIAQMTEENSASAANSAGLAKQLNDKARSIRETVSAYRV